ncbi:hypothetical protein QBC34DRAFT_301591 [Podospora aff. communis PSN243]|uniref:CCHC-type domain-containing protein n=1 Tax=Podospora aff. communis PSN243 TaxID=3040156 RepID=A0AAV9GLR9_9PEZI|nr:hypothetical protein QBC34DRAFT_301591 [Podospora aff. communis PSN243]
MSWGGNDDNAWGAATGGDDAWGATTTAAPADNDAFGADNSSAGNDGNDFGNADAGDNFGGERNGGGGSGGCFNCGEDGHMKSECTKPRVERTPQGPCRHCNEEGHYARDCKAPRKIDRSHLPDATTDEAWAMILEGVKEKDIDDIKHGVQVYAKASPETTFVDLEKAFRDQDIGLFLVAIEKPIAVTLTNMDLQGHMEKKFTVTYRFSFTPPRPRDREIWPADHAENLERLADAGEVTDRGKPKCLNCNEIGHIAKSCPQEKVEKEKTNVIKCFNCDGEGHRMRDCPIPRVDKFACKNCGKSGHKVADCPEPRSAENVECRKCNEMGHFSKDCPKGGGGDAGICRNCGGEGHMARDCTEPRKIQCRNCDEFGHMSKECPKPRDITRVKCSNCQEMGHFKSRCPNPTVNEDAVGDGGFNSGGGDFGSGGNDFGGGDSGGGDFGATITADNGGW